MEDYYQILGLEYPSSQEEIKKAYYELSKIYHPDKNNNSEVSNKIFKELNEAYQALSNINKNKLQSPVAYKTKDLEYKMEKAYYEYKNAESKKTEIEQLIKSLDYEIYKSKKKGYEYVMWLKFWPIYAVFIYLFTCEKKEPIYSPKKNTLLFAEPNNKSKIRDTLNTYDSFIIIRETKYFAQIKHSEESKDTLGFVLLEDIKQK